MIADYAPPPMSRADRASSGKRTWSASWWSGLAPLVQCFVLSGAACACDPRSWSIISIDLSENAPPLLAVWGAGPNDVWAGGLESTVRHWDGRSLVSPVVPSGDISCIWGAGPDDVWIAAIDSRGRASLYRGGVAGWVQPPGLPSDWNAHWVWGASVDEVWVVGDDFPGRTPLLGRWNGSGWERFPVAIRDLARVAGSGPNDVWVYGDEPDDWILHWDGTAWSVPPGVPSGARCVGGIWVAGPNDLWLAGCQGFGPGADIYNSIVHWDGANWREAYVEPWFDGGVPYIDGLWGCRSNDLWAVGYPNLLIHWDGTKWTKTVLPRDQVVGTIEFTAAWGTCDGDVWAVGTRIAIFRYR